MATDRRKLVILQEAIRKARNEAIKGNAQEYLKRFKKQPWYNAAVSGYVEITDQLGVLLQEWQSDTLKIIGRDNLFTGPVDAVEKAGKYRTEEYLDNRYNKVVVDDIRDELVELQQLYRSKLEALFESVVAGKLATGITGALKTDHFPFNFNKYNTLVRDTLRDKKIHWAKQVADTTEQQVKSALVDGYEKGLSSFDIASNIKARTTFSIFRAEKVARTETMASASLADYARFAANDDVIGYRWRSANNARSRASHKAANNQFRAKGQPFMVGGFKMLHPGDNTYGAPAKEIVNCRCWLEPVFADDPLSYSEIASVKRYISSDAYRINEKLRDVVNLDANDMELIYNLDSTLARMPKFSGSVTRDLLFFATAGRDQFVSEHLSALQSEEPIQYHSYLSTTSLQEYNDQVQVKLRIKSKNGRDIRKFNAGECEILFERDAKFKVLKMYIENGVVIFEMEEI